jgi:hypothetical protein
MRFFSASILAVVISTANLSAYAQLIRESRYRELPKASIGYDGNWWGSAEPQERDGYFSGAADCLTWAAYAGRAFWGSSAAFTNAEVTAEVTKYYRDHPADRKLSVIEVWRNLGPQIGKSTPQTKGGEIYTNPHGYFDGTWYRQASEAERFGFLEGYIGCLRSYLKDSDETYSLPIHEYDDKIWDYISAHPTSYRQAIADILRDFRDRPKLN